MVDRGGLAGDPQAFREKREKSGFGDEIWPNLDDPVRKVTPVNHAGLWPMVLRA